MAGQAHLAHSLAEAYLYVMATPCDSCKTGSLASSEARCVHATDEQSVMSIETTCRACEHVSSITFSLPSGWRPDNPASVAVVNPTEDPSRIIDVAQWLTLFRLITEAASEQTDKIEGRRLGLEAAKCLEEALKFYDATGNDLPPPEALFHESSRRHMQSSPQHFSRQRLIELRAKLPSEAAMRSLVTRQQKKKRWWQRGR